MVRLPGARKAVTVRGESSSPRPSAAWPLLDRDLSPEERLHGDRQDKSDWQEVRRSLKDAATKLNRYVKEHDVGETSAAGKKVWFTEVFRKFVEPKRPCEEIFELHREFEAYRKRLQLLLQNMGLAHTNVAQEVERRAQQVLFRLVSRTHGSAQNDRLDAPPLVELQAT